MSGRLQRLRQGRPGHVVCLLAGFLLTGAFAPFDLWPLAIFALWLLLWQLEGQSPVTAAWRGWLFGFGLYGSGASWVYVSIHTYGAASPMLAGSLTVLFCAGLALFITLPCLLLARLPGSPLLLFPALWVLGEWFRSWFLTGFPWLLAGTSQIDGPLSGWFPVLGVYGVSLLLAAVATVLHALAGRRLPLAVGLALLLAIPLGGKLLTRIDWVEKDGPALSAALVQANVPQNLKWTPGHLEEILGLYQRLSEDLWGHELVIWPEAAIPALPHRVDPFLQTIHRRADEAGSALLLGIPTADFSQTPERVYNSVVGLGHASGRYHKQRLVPFGEYVPLESLLRGLISFFDLPMSSFSSGAGDQAPLQAQGRRLSAFICYEVVYPNLVGAGSRDVQMLLTVSNDTWFGASIGPLQHLQMARLRALENARPLLRATNDGVSALIDHQGQIIVRGKQFSQEIITGEVQPMQGLTLFSRWQSWPVLILCGLLLAVAALRTEPSKIGS